MWCEMFLQSSVKNKQSLLKIVKIDFDVLFGLYSFLSVNSISVTNKVEEAPPKQN